MDAAKTILRQSDAGSIDAMAPNERLTVTVKGCNDLVFEKIGPGRLRVGHRVVRQGNSAFDPEIVFRIEGDAWIPIEYTRKPAVHRYDETGLAVGSFLTQWNERLRRRGFLDAIGTDSATS